MRRLGFLLLLYAVIDGTASSILYAKCSIDVININLRRIVFFNFYQDLTDIWMLGLLRCYILTGVAVAVLWRPQIAISRLSVVKHIVCGFSTLVFLFVLIKLLLTTETSSAATLDLFYWLQISWAFIACISPMAIFFAFGSMTDKASAETLSQNSSSNESTASLLSESHKEKPVEVKENTGILRLLSFSKPDAHIVITAFIFLIIAAVADVLSPKYIGEVIAGIVISRSIDEFTQAIILFSVANIVSSLATGVRGGLFSVALARLGKRARDALFGSILKQEVAFFDQTRTGDIMSRLSADVATMTDTLALNVNIFLRSFVKAVGISFMMFSLSWRLSLITVAGLPLIAIANQFFGNIYEKLSSSVQDAVSKTSQVAEEAISNIRTVLSLAGEQFEHARYCQRLDGVYTLQMREAFVYASSIWTTQLLSLGLTVGTLYYGGHLVVTEQLDGKYLVTFLIYQMTLGDCLQSMGSVYTGLMQALGASRKVIEYLDRKPEQKRSGPLKPLAIKGKIEFKNVSFHYPARKDAPVLKNISFTVEPGKVVALVGKSGSGKSSCLALLERFYDPLGGEILFDGRAIGDYDHAFLHRAVAMVSQEPVLFARSIRENILFATSFPADQGEVEHAAKLADADSFVDNLPGRYETECGEKGTQLSAGQKQRIAIARALIRKPDVLLLDEATSALDASAEAAVQETLSRAMAGRTVLVVAHRLSTIRNADKILVMEHGVIVESGNHDELIAKGGHYANLVQKQLTLGALNEGKETPVTKNNAIEVKAEVHQVNQASFKLGTSPGVALYRSPESSKNLKGSPDKDDDHLSV